MLVYSGLAGTGHFLYGNMGLTLLCAVPSIVSAAGLVWLMPKILRDRKEKV
jgi:hypothetical protein